MVMRRRKLVIIPSCEAGGFFKEAGKFFKAQGETRREGEGGDGGEQQEQQLLVLQLKALRTAQLSGPNGQSRFFLADPAH